MMCSRDDTPLDQTERKRSTKKNTLSSQKLSQGSTLDTESKELQQDDGVRLELFYASTLSNVV
ncbi:hypothetical protein Taro_005009 [Colocasia esculenta]|uniref:Uncharacterized protein n=1 Tax=Colocasia esculenta TaxID=4460 RepID=A0A843TNV3_COLES|nr:hypothetical protein [Colocasia esculenta]